jgi:drug/metabolite transporter (DMT)-like permease
LAPVFATILAWIFLGEKLSPLALFGILLTVSGVFWVVNEEHHDKIHGSKSRGILLGILAALGQGAGVILAKYGFRTEIDTLPATILRMVPATIVMWMAALLIRRASSVKILFKDPKAARFIFIASILGPFIGVWLANVAVKYTEAGIAATLLSIVPIVIIPMIWVVRRTKPSLRAITGTILAVIGVALIFLR